MATTKLWTLEDSAALRDDDVVHELWNGELWKMPRPGSEHGGICMNVAAPLHVYTRQRGRGRVLINDTGVALRHDPDTVVGPDIAFVRTEDLPLPKRWLTATPALVVEVVSPPDETREILEKIEIYKAAGVPLIWTLHPATKTVLVDGSGRERLTLGESDSLERSDILPGLTPIPVADLLR